MVARESLRRGQRLWHLRGYGCVQVVCLICDCEVCAAMQGVTVSYAGINSVALLEDLQTERPEMEWPTECSCAEVQSIDYWRTTIGTCPEHRGAWSYKCGACATHVERLKQSRD